MSEEKPQVVSRERRLIRSRESQVTLSAWRVELVLPGGARGAITHVEPWYRGEGTLLGSSQERLASLWRSTLPETTEEPPPQQWG
jgi:hypothetical protein